MMGVNRHPLGVLFVMLLIHGPLIQSASFCGLQQRVSFFCNGSSIVSVPDFSQLSTNVNRIDIRLTGIAVLRNGDFWFSGSVFYLFLEMNQITTIEPKAFQNLTQLNSLNIHKNFISVLPVGVFDSLTSVQYLDVSNNFFTYLGPDFFRGLGKLRALNMDNCELEGIHESTFQHTPLMRNIDIHANVLTDLPDNLFGPVRNSLTHLKINRNRLTELRGEHLQGLTNLLVLDAAFCKIEQFDYAGVTADLHSITEWQMDVNKLSIILNTSFAAVTTLTSIQFRANQITYIEFGSFNMLPKLETCELIGNPVQCSIIDIDTPSTLLPLSSDNCECFNFFTPNNTDTAMSCYELSQTPTTSPTTSPTSPTPSPTRSPIITTTAIVITTASVNAVLGDDSGGGVALSTIVIIACACGVVVGLLVVVFVRRRKGGGANARTKYSTFRAVLQQAITKVKLEFANTFPSNHVLTTKVEQGLLKEDVIEGFLGSVSGQRTRSTSVSATSRSTAVTKLKLKIFAENSGNYGYSQAVLLKSSIDVDLESACNFLREPLLLMGLSHKSVVRAAIATTANPFMWVVEQPMSGDLKLFLRACRPSLDTPRVQLETSSMCKIGADLGGALAYIHTQDILHNAVAAFNVYVGSTIEVVKIGNFESARPIAVEMNYYARQHFQVKDVARVTLKDFEIERSLAPEMLADNTKASVQSDVWSFATLLFEIFSFGKRPYGLLSQREILHGVCHDNLRLGRPPTCPKQVYKVLQQCWSLNPVERPSVHSVCRLLTSHHLNSANGDENDTKTPQHNFGNRVRTVDEKYFVTTPSLLSNEKRFQTQSSSVLPLTEDHTSRFRVKFHCLNPISIVACYSVALEQQQQQQQQQQQPLRVSDQDVKQLSWLLGMFNHRCVSVFVGVRSSLSPIHVVELADSYLPLPEALQNQSKLEPSTPDRQVLAHDFALGCEYLEQQQLGFQKLNLTWCLVRLDATSGGTCRAKVSLAAACAVNVDVLLSRASTAHALLKQSWATAHLSTTSSGMRVGDVVRVLLHWKPPTPSMKEFDSELAIAVAKTKDTTATAVLHTLMQAQKGSGNTSDNQTHNHTVKSVVLRSELTHVASLGSGQFGAVDLMMLKQKTAAAAETSFVAVKSLTLHDDDDADYDNDADDDTDKITNNNTNNANNANAIANANANTNANDPSAYTYEVSLDSPQQQHQHQQQPNAYQSAATNASSSQVVINPGFDADLAGIGSSTDEFGDVVAPTVVEPLSTLVKEFYAEAATMDKARHPNLVSLLGICDDANGPPLMVMEYLNGGALEDWLKPNFPISDSATFHILYQVVLGLEALADLGLIHRDLASRNVLVGPNLVVKIADFGMSRWIERAANNNAEGVEGGEYYRMNNFQMLPLRWMAPELLINGFRCTLPSDIYSFGVLSFELFTGAAFVPYFNVQDDQMVQLLVSNEELSHTLFGQDLLDQLRSSPISPVLSIVERCLHRSDKTRPSASDLVREFGDVATLLVLSDDDDVVNNSDVEA